MIRCIPIFLLLICLSQKTTCQSYIKSIYTFGDIPSSFSNYDPTCTGPLTKLSIELPSGDAFQIDSVFIEYDMYSNPSTSLGAAWLSDQNSQIYCQNTGILSPVFEGIGNSSGTYSYAFADTLLANGIYGGNTEISFEMRAWRDFHSSAGCGTNVINVPNSTWKITLYYHEAPNPPKVGINQTTPMAALDVNGALRVGYTELNPQAGMIRFNPNNNDFEGFNGTSWLTLTQGVADWSAPREKTQSNLVVPDEFSIDSNTFIGHQISTFDSLFIVGKSTGVGTGRVYIFQNASDGISPTISFSNPDYQNGDYFGSSLEIYQDRIIVGAKSHNNGSTNNAGKVYIYKHNGVLAWNLEADFYSPNVTANNQFGSAVGINDKYCIVGEPYYNSGAGKVYIYKRTGTSWNVDTEIVCPDPALSDNFGTKVKLYGDYAFISMEYTIQGAYLKSGRVYIYKNINGTWTLQTTLMGDDNDTADKFGTSLTFDGNWLAVGAPKGGVKGEVYTFKFDNGSWTFHSKIISNFPHPKNWFGVAVDIKDGKLLIGDYGHPVNGILYSGRAFLYEFKDEGWQFINSFVPHESKESMFFGIAVAFIEEKVLVSAPQIVNNGNGIIYVFEK